MDPEIFKVILNGGSFGLLAIIVVWLLWKGAPAIQDAVIRLGEDHKSVVMSLNTANKCAIEYLAQAHKDAVAALVKDCREERRELVQRLIAERKS